MGVQPGGNAVSRQDVYNSFRGQGLPHNQAAAFAGVVSQEGGYRGGLYTGSFGNQATENGGVLNPRGAFGIAQWNGPRQAGLAEYARANGMLPTDLNAQTGFAVQEARARGIDMGSTRDIVNRFEVPRADLRAGEIARANQTAAGFDPASYTGQATNGQAASSDGTTAQAGTIETDAGDGTIRRQTMNPDGTVNEVQLGGANTDENGNPVGGGSGTAANQGSGQSSPNGAQGGSGQSQSPGSGSGGSGFGGYMNEIARAIASALSPSTEKSGQTVATATEKSGTTIAKGSTDAAGIAAAQSKATNTLFSDLSKDYFGRAIVVILGIVFVAGGVAMFVYNRNPIAMAKQALT